jgi:folylpolyglutamate synthase/dihydropteroate synthase
MGGKLDATNILNNHCVSVIAKIARDHEAFLGNTLSEIAGHKAGILRPNVPYIVNPDNEHQVQNVIDDYAREIGAGPRLSAETPQLRKGLYSTEEWRNFALHLLPFQRDNAAMAIVAVREAMKGLGSISDDMIADEFTKKRWQRLPGRLEQPFVVPVFGSIRTKGRPIIVDGAHNVDAAIAMHNFVKAKGRKQYIPNTPAPGDGYPVTWVLAMTDGKDAAGYLKVILKPGDKVITTSFGSVDGMPWVKPMDPEELLKIAQSIQPDITGLAMPKQGALRALTAAKYLSNWEHPIVLTGSLYLVGDFHRELQESYGGGKLPLNNQVFWSAEQYRNERNVMIAIDREEAERVRRLLRNQDTKILEDMSGNDDADLESPWQKKKKLLAEIEALDRQTTLTTIEQQKAAGQNFSYEEGIDDVEFPSQRESKKSRQRDGKTGAPKPLTFRPFPGKYKELRERSKKLKPTLDEVIETEQEAPKIRMFFGDDPKADRRDFKRPGFVTEQRYKSGARDEGGAE